MSSAAPEPDVHVAAAIARAEWQRDMAQELAVVGMALAKDIAQRSMDAPYHPELRHDPGRSFASVSRAVRLTLALMARIDEQIFALRNGITPAPDATPELPAVVAPAKAGPRPDVRPQRIVRERLWEALDQEIGDGEAADRLRDTARERLIEREDYDDLLAGDFQVCLDAIRADLGLPLDGFREPEEGGLGSLPNTPTPDARIGDNPAAILAPRAVVVEIEPHRRQ